MPVAVAPKSSTAMRAATTEPWPPLSEYVPDISVKTPILMAPSVYCAFAAPHMSAAPKTTQPILRFMKHSPRSVRGAASLNAQIIVELLEICVELGIQEMINDPAVIHHIV